MTEPEFEIIKTSKRVYADFYNSSILQEDISESLVDFPKNVWDAHTIIKDNFPEEKSDALLEINALLIQACDQAQYVYSPQNGMEVNDQGITNQVIAQRFIPVLDHIDHAINGLSPLHYPQTHSILQGLRIELMQALSEINIEIFPQIGDKPNNKQDDIISIDSSAYGLSTEFKQKSYNVISKIIKSGYKVDGVKQRDSNVSIFAPDQE